MLLSKIHSPQDLRSLQKRELPKLAQEIRTLIADVVSRTGGHLASNLGVVELAIALHYVFDFAKDRLVWDVSHQTYAHKILTGRADAFHTLRQKSGLSGFSNPAESEYDVFTAGHAGTSLSTALGLAAGDSLKNADRKIVVVIGDGAIGTGMAFEALNNAAAVGKNLIIILNDNRMSISKTVGALSQYLNKLRTEPIYLDLKKEIYDLASSLPIVGARVEQTVERILSAVRSSVMPGHIFVEFGLEYYGPIDGHNIEVLLELLNRIKRSKKPVLLHVLTEKGKGYAPAESNPEKFHSASGHLGADGKVRTNNSLSPNPTYTDAFADALINLATDYPDLVAITAAMPEGTGLDRFREKFPHRCFDVGICEQHALGLAAGLAKSGTFPVFAVYSTFLQRAYDQVFHEICLQNAPCIIAIDRAGVVGSDGPTHHGLFDIAYLRTLPNIVLAAPKNGSEIYSIMKFAIDNRLTLALRYPRDHCPDQLPACADAEISLGKGEILKEGSDIALLGYGSTVQSCLDAAENLEKEKIFVTVANARFAKPIDRELIQNLAENHKVIVTVEEHALAGGFGSAVLETLSELFSGQRDATQCSVFRIGVPDELIPHASRRELLSQLCLDPASIAKLCKSLILCQPQCRL
jgi:1-deoxy-D-xylulose-5-phosphate synthase